ncbi:MAG: hypothetical protein IH595_07325 [Bacteroidales bacterium]|nr:hypothetical protein [Bacteroidales bacterium]
MAKSKRSILLNNILSAENKNRQKRLPPTAHITYGGESGKINFGAFK